MDKAEVIRCDIAAHGWGEPEDPENPENPEDPDDPRIARARWREARHPTSASPVTCR